MGRGDNATQPTRTARNSGQTQSLVADCQPATLTNPIANSRLKLSLCVWQHQGKSSEVEVVYWALESAKQAALERLLIAQEGSEDFEDLRFQSTKAQELQHNLFTIISGLASDLSRSANGMSHE